MPGGRRSAGHPGGVAHSAPRVGAASILRTLVWYAGLAPRPPHGPATRRPSPRRPPDPSGRRPRGDRPGRAGGRQPLPPRPGGQPGPPRRDGSPARRGVPGRGGAAAGGGHRGPLQRPAPPQAHQLRRRPRHLVRHAEAGAAPGHRSRARGGVRVPGGDPARRGPRGARRGRHPPPAPRAGRRPPRQGVGRPRPHPPVGPRLRRAGPAPRRRLLWAGAHHLAPGPDLDVGDRGGDGLHRGPGSVVRPRGDPAPGAGRAVPLRGAGRDHDPRARGGGRPPRAGRRAPRPERAAHGRALPDARGDRARGDGPDLVRQGRRDRARGRGEGPARGQRRPREHDPALLDRGAGHRAARAPVDHPDPRRGAAALGRAVLRDEEALGPDAGRGPRRPRGGRRGHGGGVHAPPPAQHLPADRQRGGLRPRPRGGPPGHQARQHHGRALRRGDPHRLGARQGAGHRRALDRPGRTASGVARPLLGGRDPVRDDHRDPAVHVPRGHRGAAGAAHAEERRVRARGGALRDPDPGAAAPRPRLRAHGDEGAARRPDPAPGAGPAPRDPGGAGGAVPARHGPQARGSAARK